MVRDYSPCTEQSRKLQLEESLLDAIPLFVFPGRHFSTLVSVLSHICSPFAVAVGEKQVHIKRSFNLNFLFFFFSQLWSCRTFRIPCRRSLPQYNNTTFTFAPGGVTFNSLCYKTAVCLNIFVLRQRETIIAHFAFRIISLAVFICVGKIR